MLIIRNKTNYISYKHISLKKVIGHDDYKANLQKVHVIVGNIFSPFSCQNNVFRALEKGYSIYFISPKAIWFFFLFSSCISSSIRGLSSYKSLLEKSGRIFKDQSCVNLQSGSTFCCDTFPFLLLSFDKVFTICAKRPVPIVTSFLTLRGYFRWYMERLTIDYLPL